MPTTLLVDLCDHYVLHADERVVRTREWPGRVAAVVHTSAGRAFLVAPSVDFRLREAPWVEEVILVRPLTGCTDEPARTSGFVVFTDGRSMSLTDRGAVAFLAGALHTGLDPVAYAEVLVAWHSGTSAPTGVVLHPDQVGGPGPPRDRPGLGAPTVAPTTPAAGCSSTPGRGGPGGWAGARHSTCTPERRGAVRGAGALAAPVRAGRQRAGGRRSGGDASGALTQPDASPTASR